MMSSESASRCFGLGLTEVVTVHFPQFPFQFSNRLRQQLADALPRSAILLSRKDLGSFDALACAQRFYRNYLVYAGASSGNFGTLYFTRSS